MIGDNPEPTQHARIMKAHEEHPSWSRVEAAVESLVSALDTNDVMAIREILIDLVPGYAPGEEVVDWVTSAKRGTPYFAAPVQSRQA